MLKKKYILILLLMMSFATPAAVRAEQSAEGGSTYLASIRFALQPIFKSIRNILSRATGHSLIAQVAGAGSGLRAHWSFDEVSGTTGYDASGAGADATLQGGVSRVSDAAVGARALYFNSSNQSARAPLSGLQTYSYSLWLKADNVSNVEQYIVSQEIVGQGSCHALSYDRANPAAVRLTFGGNSISTTLSATQWTHIAVTNDSANGTTGAKVYLNGALLSTAGGQTCSQSFSDILVVGEYPTTLGSDTRDFRGKVDDVRVYDRALSEADVSSIYNNRTVPFRSNGEPSGSLPAGTTETTISLSTPANATCKYSTVANTLFAAMSNQFTTTGGTTHEQNSIIVSDGGVYRYFVRCQDQYGNTNGDDYEIAFTISTAVQSGLLVHWKFDELSGTTASDSSGNSNSGTLTGASFSDSAGRTAKIFRSFLFDGNDDVVSRPTLSSSLAGNTTLAGWFRTTQSSGSAKKILELGESSTVGLSIELINGTVRMAALGGPGTSITGPTVNNDAWHHAVIVRSGATYSFYVDGAFVGSRSGTVRTYSKLFAGRASDATAALAGRIDDVRVYNRALTVSEVQKLWTDGINEPILYFTFDTIQGPSVVDSSGNVNNGTITGAVSATGKIGSGLQFDGNDWVSIPGTSSLDVTRMTVAAWVKKLANPTTWGTIVGRQWGSGSDDLWSFFYFDNSPTFDYTASVFNDAHAQPTDDCDVETAFSSATDVDIWTHLAATYDGVVLTLYRNGAKVSSITCSGNIRAGGSEPITIGAQHNDGTATPSQFVSMVADEVRIYNRALSQAEIVGLMETGTPPTISDGAPVGALPAGTSQVTLSIKTNQTATCKYGTVSNTAYASIVNTFTSTNSTTHSSTVSVSNGNIYNYYVRCNSVAGTNAADYTINFSVLPLPLIRLKFDEGSGTTPANTGVVNPPSTFTRSSPTPAWTTNKPSTPAGGSYALDFGTATGNYYVESPSTISALGGLTKFTVTGWVNNKSSTMGSGGNRIVSWINNGGDGVDIVYRSDGSIQMGIDQWPDIPSPSPAISSIGQIPTNSSAPDSNWKYFAVTYDSTLSSNHVSFYFGTNTATAAWDTSKTYSRGAVGTNLGSARLAIGHFNNATRSGSTYDRMFRGVIDNIQIFNSVLTLDEIRYVQEKSVVVDTVAPVRTSATASSFPTNTTEVSITLTTDEPATCKYSLSSGVSYSSMTKMFTSVDGGRTHSRTTPVANGASYSHFVRCQDQYGNYNTSDYQIDFSIESPSAARLTLGSRVRTNALADVRVNAGFVHEPPLGNQDRNSRGVLVAGPKFVDDKWWWNVNFENQGVDGWVIEDYLDYIVPLRITYEYF